MEMVLVVIGSMLVPLLTAVVLVAVGAGALWLWRQLFPPAVDCDPGAPPAALLPPGWDVLVLVCSMASVPGWIMWAPDAAQTEHLWERLRGYPATVLSVPLQSDSPAQRDAVLQLLDPLRTVGSRRIGVHRQGRYGQGGWTDTTVVPAYYRVQDKHLEVALARPLPPEALEHFAQLLQTLQDTETASLPWVMVAAWHCRLQEMQPLVPWESRSRQLQAMQRRIQVCEGPRSDALAVAATAVAGQVGLLQSEEAARFSPWWNLPEWTVWSPVPDAERVQP